MKRFIEGLDRSHTTLLPNCIDDYVDEDNPVRAVDAFVDFLDLAALGIDVEPEATGRPGYHPATMLPGGVWGRPTRAATLASARRLPPERSDWPHSRKQHRARAASSEGRCPSTPPKGWPFGNPRVFQPATGRPPAFGRANAASISRRNL